MATAIVSWVSVRGGRMHVACSIPLSLVAPAPAADQQWSCLHGALVHFKVVFLALDASRPSESTVQSSSWSHACPTRCLVLADGSDEPGTPGESDSDRRCSYV